MNSNNPNAKTDKMESYYEQSTYQTIEKAELAETVTSDGFKEVKGKFFLKVMTPSLDTNEVETKVENGIQSSNYAELMIPPHLLFAFAKPQFEEMVHTPNDGEYDHNGASGNKIVMTFASAGITIPKGSVFLVEFLGGNLEIGAACVIGVYSVAETTE